MTTLGGDSTRRREDHVGVETARTERRRARGGLTLSLKERR